MSVYLNVFDFQKRGKSFNSIYITYIEFVNSKMFWLQLLAAIKYNDRLILRQFCLSGIESIQNIVSAEKKNERERTECLTKKSEKSKEKKTFDDARVEKTYSDDD